MLAREQRERERDKMKPAVQHLASVLATVWRKLHAHSLIWPQDIFKGWRFFCCWGKGAWGRCLISPSSTTLCLSAFSAVGGGAVIACTRLSDVAWVPTGIAEQQASSDLGH